MKRNKLIIIIPLILFFNQFLMINLNRLKSYEEVNENINNSSINPQDFYFYWNGSFAPLDDPLNLYYWEGFENFTYLGSNIYSVN